MIPDPGVFTVLLRMQEQCHQPDQYYHIRNQAILFNWRLTRLWSALRSLARAASSVCCVGFCVRSIHEVLLPDTVQSKLCRKTCRRSTILTEQASDLIGDQCQHKFMLTLSRLRAKKKYSEIRRLSVTEHSCRFGQRGNDVYRMNSHFCLFTCVPGSAQLPATELWSFY